MGGDTAAGGCRGLREATGAITLTPTLTLTLTMCNPYSSTYPILTQVASGALRSGQPYAYYLEALGEEYADADKAADRRGARVDDDTVAQ